MRRSAAARSGWAIDWKWASLACSTTAGRLVTRRQEAANCSTTMAARNGIRQLPKPLKTRNWILLGQTAGCCPVCRQSPRRNSFASGWRLRSKSDWLTSGNRSRRPRPCGRRMRRTAGGIESGEVRPAGSWIVPREPANWVQLGRTAGGCGRCDGKFCKWQTTRRSLQLAGRCGLGGARACRRGARSGSRRRAQPPRELSAFVSGRLSDLEHVHRRRLLVVWTAAVAGTVTLVAAAVGVWSWLT